MKIIITYGLGGRINIYKREWKLGGREPNGGDFPGWGGGGGMSKFSAGRGGPADMCEV